MKYKKRLPIFILCLLLFFFISTSLSLIILSSEVGYIADKNENRIWLVQDEGSVGMVEQESPGEIGGVYYETKWIPSFIKNKIKIGQKVEVYSTGEIQASNPGSGKAIFIVILDE